jgi:hypothetical protein
MVKDMLPTFINGAKVRAAVQECLKYRKGLVGRGERVALVASGLRTPVNVFQDTFNESVSTQAASTGREEERAALGVPVLQIELEIGIIEQRFGVSSVF